MWFWIHQRWHPTLAITNCVPKNQIYKPECYSCLLMIQCLRWGSVRRERGPQEQLSIVLFFYIFNYFIFLSIFNFFLSIVFKLPQEERPKVWLGAGRKVGPVLRLDLGLAVSNWQENQKTKTRNLKKLIIGEMKDLRLFSIQMQRFKLTPFFGF